MSSAPSHPMHRHPAPLSHRVKLHESVLGLFGGPLAWFVQLCCGYALASERCFKDGERLADPMDHLHWTSQAIAALMVLAVAVAIVSFIVSWGAFKRTRQEIPGDPLHLLETGAGRTRFLALWGMLLGAGFAAATALTAVAFITLPRCAG